MCACLLGQFPYEVSCAAQKVEFCQMQMLLASARFHGDESTMARDSWQQVHIVSRDPGGPTACDADAGRHNSAIYARQIQLMMPCRPGTARRKPYN